MFGLSFGEILVLGVMALILIGPKQLPEVARNIGRFLNDLKRATEGLTDDLKKQAKVDFDFNTRPLPKPVPPATVADANKESETHSSEPPYPPGFEPPQPDPVIQPADHLRTTEADVAAEQMKPAPATPEKKDEHS